MWPSVTYETYKWERDPNELSFISKRQRRKILPTYEAAIPASIAAQNVQLSSDLTRRISEVEVSIARFDQAQASKEYSLPALLLRSESSSSSQIERLTSSVRNVALAELSDKAPSNATLIANNIAAMREALGQKDDISIDSICAIHDVLMQETGDALGIRDVQVWIGGTFYSPHGAIFVPPHASRVRECLNDLIRFGKREDIPPIAKAALFHAQFETIHPFTDGNGRTGRALLHRVLSQEEVLICSMLPLSAGLLHDVENYMSALSAYHDGEIEPIIECVANALELAVAIGARVDSEVDGIISRWKTANTDRADSASHRLPYLLVEQPVVNSTYIAKHLEISDRAARSLIERMCDRGILRKMGNARRGAFYQATELIEVLEEASSFSGMQRANAS